MNKGLTKEQRDGIEFAMSYISNEKSLTSSEYMEFESGLKEDDSIVYKVVRRGREIAELRYDEELDKRALSYIGINHAMAEEYNFPAENVYGRLISHLKDSGKLSRGRELQERFYPKGIREARHEVDKQLRLEQKSKGKEKLVPTLGGR